jgi:hypothetical protein
MKMIKDDDDHPNRAIEELTRTTEELRELSEEADTSRERDAQYPYVAAILPVFRDMKARGVTKQETKKMLQISGVKNGERLRHPIRRIIAATSDINDKAASKITRALRYGYRKNWTDVARELKENGGIAACAKKYSRLKKTRKSKN